MAKHCTNCNADLSATSKFCGECGTPVSPPPA
jgi:predicted amidophosphoribosyltransferase